MDIGFKKELDIGFHLDIDRYALDGEPVCLIQRNIKAALKKIEQIMIAM